MRKLLENVITQEDADLLPPPKMRHIKLKTTENPAILKVLEAIFRETGLRTKDLHAMSYARISHQPQGHGWHNDKGQLGERHTNSHMNWCRVGASVLLTDDFTGGTFWYKDNWNSTIQTAVSRNKFDLVLHDSDQIHSVSPNKGNRVALLIFI